MEIDNIGKAIETDCRRIMALAFAGGFKNAAHYEKAKHVLDDITKTPQCDACAQPECSKCFAKFVHVDPVKYDYNRAAVLRWFNFLRKRKFFLYDKNTFQTDYTAGLDEWFQFQETSKMKPTIQYTYS